MNNKTIIYRCELPMRNGILDNDYVFYDDGTIVHEYDKNQNKFNLEEQIVASDIHEEEKKKILENCPNEFIDRIRLILYPAEQ
jgi:hypothetical protein